MINDKRGGSNVAHKQFNVFCPHTRFARRAGACMTVRIRGDGAFTHRCFYTEKIVRSYFTLTDRSFPTRAKQFTQTSLYTQTLLHPDALTHQNLYTQNFLHTEAFTQRNFDTVKPLHRASFAQKCFYKEAFAHKHLSTQKILHTEAFT